MDMIEREKLIELLAEMQGRCATKAALVQNSKIWRLVKAMPTVEAIPISWLEDFRDGLDTLSESKLMRAIDLIIDAYRVEKKREEE